jgi:hypothetical protein
MKNSKMDENTQQGEKPPSEETGTQAMFLEVLKRMYSHTASMDHLTAASKARSSKDTKQTLNSRWSQ